VLTLIISPVLMKSGTWTTRPVSQVAGFWTLEAVSPLMPSELSVTLSVTEEGRSIVTGVSSMKRTSALPFATS
jgi:hypothetical protein